MTHPPQPPHQPGGVPPHPPQGPPPSYPPHRAAAGQHPGQQPVPGGWQPQPAPPQPAPPQPAGPSVADYIVRLTGAGEIKVSPREQAALLAAGVREAGPQRLLVWRRTMLIVLLPVLLAVLGLMLWNLISRSSDDAFKHHTPLGATLEWVPFLTWLLVPLGTLAAIIRWTELRWSSRVLFWTWLTATVIPLVTALVPIDWRINLRDMVVNSLNSDFATYEDLIEGATPAQIANYDTEIGAWTNLQNMVFAVNFAIILLPIIVGLVGGVLRGARRSRGMLPSAVLPSWFVLVAAPFYSIIMLTVFAVISPVFGNGLLTTGILLVALAPLVYVFAGRRYTLPMNRADARPVLTKFSLVSLAISVPGTLLIVIYMFTGEALGSEVLGTPGQVDGDKAVFSYIDAAEMGVSLFARFQLTSVVMCMLFARLVYREWKTVESMSDQVRDEYVVEMQALERFEEAGESSGPHAAQAAQPSAPLGAGPWNASPPPHAAHHGPPLHQPPHHQPTHHQPPHQEPPR